MHSFPVDIKKKFIDFLVTLSENATMGFSGAGFVLYHNIHLLSGYHCNLVRHRPLPVLQLGTNDFNAFIEKVSNLNHPCHDGFHFINAGGILTHIAQFFSPPANAFMNNIRGQGARTFCSQVGSLLPGVILIGSVSITKNIYVFEKGKLIQSDNFTKRYSTCF
ncbi:MAG TPA: hypothetical protein VHM20_05300 [Gammaproteobacteria bacterium]|jgi:hypothetical protein|nr:hypothetical protein [Gammaproteobacteria bacterium]